MLKVVLVAWLKGFEAFREGIIANFAVFAVVIGDFAVLPAVSCAHHQVKTHTHRHS